jgi:cytochrome c biogenesis protein ResB
MNVKFSDYTGKLLKFFKSLRLTVTVIALLILLYFLGLVLPQKWMFESIVLYDEWMVESRLNRVLDFLRFTDIYVSPLTIILLIVFFLNLIVVTMNRVPVMLKRAFIGSEKPSFGIEQLRRKGGSQMLSCEGTKDRTIDRIKIFFNRRKWFCITGKQEGTFLVVKNRYSPLGFLLFHLSFLLCLIGGLMISYTRFSGRLALTEGQTFDGDIKQFRSILSEPRIFGKLPALGLLLEKVHPYYENNVPTQLVVDMQVKYRDEVKGEVLRVNEPIKRGPMSIIAETIGVSPLFIIRGLGGKEVDGAYVSLNVLNGQKDSFQFERDNRFTFFVSFYPDYVVKDGVEKTKSIELKNPAIHLTIERGGKREYEGTMKKGEYVKLGPFTKIGFEDIRYWAEFLIIREYGKYPLIAGFFFASIGLIMRLVFYQKRMRIAIEYMDNKSLLYIDSKSEYFQYSFKDEMERLVTSLNNFLDEKDTTSE